MEHIINPNKNISYALNTDDDLKQIHTLARALASYERLQILRLLADKSMNISAIAQALNLPVSTVSDHITVLEEAKILFVTTEQGVKRHIKMCNKQLNELTLFFYTTQNNTTTEPYVLEIPVGMFSEVDIHAPCGMYIINSNHPEDNKQIGQDLPVNFFDPKRRNAELLWFSHGFVSYIVPNPLFNKSISKVELSFECCSEIVYHKNDWPSDITIKVNDIPALTFNSPGDFGGRRGKYSPMDWGLDSTQFGLLYRISLDEKGVYLNDIPVSKSTIKDFHLEESNSIKISFGVAENAIHRGGINLFGKKFGDYEQSILLKIYP